jgi:hypothetical protein
LFHLQNKGTELLNKNNYTFIFSTDDAEERRLLLDEDQRNQRNAPTLWAYAEASA